LPNRPLLVSTLLVKKSLVIESYRESDLIYLLRFKVVVSRTSRGQSSVLLVEYDWWIEPKCQFAGWLLVLWFNLTQALIKS